MARRDGVPPARNDLLLVALILIVVDAAAAAFLVYVYFPARRDEALAREPAQLALLARDRQNALAGWVAERLADAELTASLLGGRAAPELLDHFLRAYKYESAVIVDGAGAEVLRRGSGDTDAATIADFARTPRTPSGAWIDFRRTAKRKPKILTACRVASPPATVVYVSDPYDYIYPLFSTVAVASKTGETNLIGLYDEWAVGLTPYRSGSPPPMTVSRRIPRQYAAEVLALGERSITLNDRRGMAVIGVVKAIPRTQWVVFAKIDQDEVVGGAVDETVRLGRLLAFVSLLLATTAFAILRSRRVHKMRAAEDQVVRLSARVLRVQDETQRRIARELHETVAQSLAGLRMNLGTMKRFVGPETGGGEIVDDSLSIVDDAMAEVRTLSYLLHPPMIDQVGLITALRWYVEGFQQRSGIATTLDAPEDLDRLPRDLETAVFRIVQESLTNVQRHSASATARVSVSRADGRLSIEIADKGRGLPAALRDNDDALLASGVGIAGINERVREVRGEMRVHSSEKGTTLSVTLPLSDR